MISTTAPSSDEQRKIARIAGRKPWNEAGLIASCGGALLFVILFMTAPYFLIPFSRDMGMSIVGAGLLFSFGISNVYSLFHVAVMKERVQEAQVLHAELQYAEQLKRDAEVKAKIAVMKDNE